jgi:hypothetical protein
MQLVNSFMQRLVIRYPIIQAPMAGGGDTPELVAAVCEAGGARLHRRSVFEFHPNRRSFAGSERTDITVIRYQSLCADAAPD